MESPSKPSTANINMYGNPSSKTPRGTPSRRVKSSRFSSDNQPLANSNFFPITFTNKPATTFIPSLYTPIQGEISINADTQKNFGPTDAIPSTLKRAPRTEEIKISKNIAQKYKNTLRNPVASLLDFSSIKTPLPRAKKKFSRSPRPFELTDCLEFFPTAEDFKDPMTYIKSITSQASAYGICKIIPPDNWKMPFVINTENFRFKTHLQLLNSFQASKRANGTGGDSGYEGKEHSLSSFQARDKELRRLWFEMHPPPTANVFPEHGDIMKNRIGNVTVSEYDVEAEFWRLVQLPLGTVEIEYGADVHSTIHGSAMPTTETHPLDPSSRDAWNLNNIPILPNSLFRFIKSDISSMTRPCVYMGMTFSTSCWSNEHHYTYGINYMHWGETKTWYGVPATDTEKFEAAIKCEAPGLFEAQPNLLFQRATLMNPKRLKEAGVQVYACNQRAGEFVVTFPKAYHADFNHGFNFNEAVNFALPDWLPFGRDCVQRYREHRKLPIFSHDELIITITQQSQSIGTAMWLIDSLKEMTDREIADRKKARSFGFGEVLEEEDRSEDQYQCNICKTFCYLSQITCPCTTKVVCVDHAEFLCETRAVHQLTLRKRLSDEELLDTLNKFTGRAAIPSAWQNKFSKLFENTRPPLYSLRALLAEGDRINYPLPEMRSLRTHIHRANKWLDSANAIIYKQGGKRSGLNDLYSLIREVDNLGFDCLEIKLLRGLLKEAEDMRLKASTLLNTPPADQERRDFLQECRRLLIQASSLNVLLEEINAVEKIVDHENLMNEIEENLLDGKESLNSQQVREFLAHSKLYDIPSNNEYVKMLIARREEGDDWERRGRNLLEQPIMTIEELDRFANMDPKISISPTVLCRLMTARAEAIDFDKQARALLLAHEPTTRAKSTKANLQNVMELCSRASARYNINSVRHLKRCADIAADLERISSKVLKNLTARGVEIFEPIVKWKAYAKEYLDLFMLPNFDKLEVQLKLRETWLKDIRGEITFSHHNIHPSTSTVPHASSGWAKMSTPTLPLSTRRRSDSESSHSNGTPQPSASTSKKRKYVEEISLHDQHGEEDPRTSVPTRHIGPDLTPMPMYPPQSAQILPPSLAKIVWPVNQA